MDKTLQKGKLYLIPAPLGENETQVLPAYVVEIIHSLDLFIVEKAKTARQYIKTLAHPKPFSELFFYELDKHGDSAEWMECFSEVEKGKNIGFLSEAGCPGIADPGADIAKLAHQKGIEVVPLVGPSSILLALMASGMNGQSFTFHGYLSPKKEILTLDLKRLEQQAQKLKQTQIFIETPYRNEQMVETAIKTLANSTHFCVAMDLTLPSQLIISKPISEWKKIKLPEINKRPAVFLII